MLVVSEIIVLIASIARLLISFNFGFSEKNIYIMAISGVAHNFVFIYAILLSVVLLLKLLTKRTKEHYTDIKTDLIILITAVVALLLSLL